MKKTLLIALLLCAGLLSQAQTKYGFSNNLDFDNWNNSDTSAGVQLVVWTPNNDTLKTETGSDVTAIDGTARNGFEYDFPPTKCLFPVGTNIYDSSNFRLIKYKFTFDTTFWGERDFYIKLSGFQGITTADIYNNRDLMRVVIDYDGSNVGIKKLDIHSYRLYPVPTSSRLFVEGVNPNSFKVYDLAGRLALAGNVMQNSIDVSEIGNGLYVLYAQTEKGMIIQKFLKN